MKNISGYIEWLKRKKAVRNRNIVLSVILSLALSCSIFWALRGVGSALTDEDVNTDTCAENGAVETCTEETDGEQEEQEEQDLFTSVTQSGIVVNCTASHDCFPEGTSMYAKDVVEDIDIDVEDILDDSKEIKGTIAVDIVFENMAGEKIEPPEGSLVNVSITLPEELRLEGEEFMLLHIEDDGVKSVEDADISSEEASFTTDSFSIYVMTALGEKEKDHINEYLSDIWWVSPTPDNYIANTENTPYCLAVGDKVTLIGYSTIQGRYFYDYSDIIQNNGATVSSEPSENSYYKNVTEFEAVSVGKTRISFEYSPNSNEYFWIEVKAAETSPDKDNPNEVNIRLDSDGSLGSYATPDNPYSLYEDDIVNIFIGSDFPEPVFLDKYGNELDGPPWQFVLKSEGADESSKYYTYDAHNSTGDDVFGVKTTYWFDRIVYFKIVDRWMLDHADIEVADNGIYTSSKIYNDDGILKKTVTRYQSYVSDVNSCVMYKSEDESETTPIYDSGRNLMEGVTGYESDDYWQNPDIKPGETQYELTSKYKKRYNESTGQWETYDYALKRFYYAEVDHAIFDVELLLKPLSEVTYKRVGDEWVLIEGSEITYDDSNAETTTVGSAIFRMERQDVIDAYNKCPNHSGLDFTIKSTSALVELECDKKLIGRDLTENEFRFEIYDTSTQETVATSYNDGTGKVFFDGIHFESTGKYIYNIREVAGSDSSIAYDDTEYQVTIVVSRNSKGDLEAEVTSATFNYEFTNSVKYTLPETGGTGTGPVYISGAALTAGAVLLLLGKRKKVVGT